MEKQMKKILIALICLMFLAAPAMAGKGKVRIAYVEWDCATASTMTAKAALEQMGYEVEVLPVAAAAMWQALGTGDVDAMVTAWLPVTHADYYEKVKDNVEKVSVVSGGAKLGWAVPTYVTINSIDELNANADKFAGRIIGIDPGAGLMKLSEQAIADYKLDKLELMEGSGATMTAALADAVKNEAWVVVTAWSPHWMFGKWDLKYLEDPKGILGGEEQIEAIVRKGLDKDMPEVYGFMSRFKWDSPGQLQMVMAWNQEGGSPEDNAKRFLKEYPDTVKGWTGQ
jgi:glycine betaine/proline transport system substrate-binding protein